jgi:dienelactone hydrolase
MGIPQIRALVQSGRRVGAYQLVERIKQVLPNDPLLKELQIELLETGNVVSEPPGALVSVQDWNATDEQWLHLGVTPLQNMALPKGELRWRFEKAGFIRREMQQRFPNYGDVSVTLSRSAEIPTDMVLIATPIPLGSDVLIRSWPKLLPKPFLIDRYEVTNEQYERFVDAGGYEQKAYWKHEFIEDGVHLTWEDAINRFRDQSERAGPSTWINGEYPIGQANHPVAGLSWYEAAAYAEFVGKSLPTIHHWKSAAIPGRDSDGVEYIVPLSNFGGNGTQAVGTSRGIGLYDVYDLAGNVAEWCLNATDDGRRCLQGGAWNDPEYIFGKDSFDSVWERSPTHGFRCMQYLGDAADEALFQPIPEIPDRDYKTETPQDINSFKSHFAYDREDPPLKPGSVTQVRAGKNYRHEVVQVNAAYNDERFDIHLFLPNHAKRPCRTMVLFPDAVAIVRSNFEQHYGEMYFAEHVNSLVERGWALCWPVCWGTFERSPDWNKNLFRLGLLDSTFRTRERYIRIAKDLSRTVDYLETRGDIDSHNLAFVGTSLGAFFGPVIVVVEPRFTAAVLIGGGYSERPLMPEVEPFNYAPHVNIPVLMINGRHDVWWPLESSQMPFYEDLGTPDKEIKLYDSGHATPADETAEFADQWLQRKLRRRPATHSSGAPSSVGEHVGSENRSENRVDRQAEPWQALDP